MASNRKETNEPTPLSNNFSSNPKQHSNSYHDHENEKLSQLNNDNPLNSDEMIDKFKEENESLKKTIELFDRKENDYNQQIQTLQMRINELEDWNTDFRDDSNLQSQIDFLTTRNRQLETDYQRLQSQQRNNQLAIERLDEYEETISQLQDELQQLRSNKKTDLFIEEQKRSESLEKLLEQTRSQLDKQTKEFNEKIFDSDKEKNIRDSLEKQLIDLNEQVQNLESENHQLQQQIQQFQASTVTPGSPPTMTFSSDSQTTILNNQQLNIIYDQFVSLLPNEYSISDHHQQSSSSLFDRFTNLFEQFSSYIGTFSIIQEELESLKQILQEKQDELEKLRTHFEIATDKLNKIHEEQSLETKYKEFDSDEDELEEILHIQQRASSQQSLLSITPGEKQQLIAQNELLSTLLNEKEQELILLQQAEKTREDLRRNFQEIQNEKDIQQIELNDIKHVLDEKIRENSSLKKEKMFFIEKISELERLRQEQQSCIQIRSTPDRETSTSLVKPIIHPTNDNNITNEQYQQLRSEYDQLSELSARQHDESVSYYNEYNRILILYNELNTKYIQLEIDYQSIQSLVQQKTEAYLQCQNELNIFKNLYYEQKKKSDDIEQLRSNLNERNVQLEELKVNEQDLLNKQNQLETNLKILQEQNTKMSANNTFFVQNQIDLKRITHERDLAIVEKKQIERQLEQIQDKLFHFEESEKHQQPQEELNKTLNNQNQYLQTNLEQTQLERDKHLKRYEEQIILTARLTNENNEFQEEIQMKNLLINQLQSEIDSKTKQIVEVNENVQTTNHSKVEKQLVKNILLSFFNTPIDKQQEALPLIGALVGFTQEEYQKAIEALANNYNSTAGSSWLTGWLGSNSTRMKLTSEPPVYHPEKSFAELLIQYVDQQSTDNSQESVLNTGTSNHATQFI